MNKTYILVDTMNTFMRAKYSTAGDIDMKIGMSLNILLNSVRKAWRDHSGTHIVFFAEGSSWRKKEYPKYKLNRVLKLAERTQREKEDDDLYFDALNDFMKYVKDQTNSTVAHCPVAEADDMIAYWIEKHPSDNHVIISSDTDFYQLLAPNVSIYDGIKEHLIKIDGVYNDKGKPVIDKKTKKEIVYDPEYELFEKCVRGDTSDNIFSAYPGVREKGSKNKTGIREAFADRHNKGFNWNNFMFQKWTDENGVEHTVKDDFEINKKLIDLKAQPDHIKEQFEKSLNECYKRQPVQNVGFMFMKFCSRWALNRIGENPKEYAEMLNARYIDEQELQQI